MPPFSGFWGKYYVFEAAADAGYWMVAAAGLVASVVAAFYYLRIIKLMWFDPPLDEQATTDAQPIEARTELGFVEGDVHISKLHHPAGAGELVLVAVLTKAGAFGHH